MHACRSTLEDPTTSFLRDFFAREKVTHLAVLQNWIEVANVDPLFVADPAPEVLEVFAWDPSRTHLVPERASSLNQRASREISAGNTAAAIELLRRSSEVDRGNSRTLFLLGAAHEASGNLTAAEAEYREALSLHPGSPAVLVRLGTTLAKQGRRDEALALVEQVMATAPGTPGARELRQTLGR